MQPRPWSASARSSSLLCPRAGPWARVQLAGFGLDVGVPAAFDDTRQLLRTVRCSSTAAQRSE
ncbi:MAG: hypothetical protein ACKVYV_00355 [Limisphaerales bacterium]